MSQLDDGAQLSYLIAVPAWCATISWGARYRARPAVDIHDRQLDWLVAVSVAVIATGVLAAAQRRLGNLALLWRLDLLALVCWAFACCVVLFGVRRTVAHRRTWFFALACWPALYLVGLGALGGGESAQDELVVSLAVLATLLAIDGHWRRLAGAALTAGVVGLVCRLVAPVGTISAILMAALVPVAATVTVAHWRADGGLIARVSPPRSGAQHQARGRLIARVASLAAVGVVVGWLVPAPFTTVAAAVGPAVGRPSPGAGWMLQDQRAYGWASVFYGSAAQLHRYRFAASGGDAVATVDVLSEAQRSAVGSVGPAVFYSGARGVVVGRARLADGLVASVDASDPGSELDPAAGGWVSVSWLSRSPASVGQCEEITVFVPEAPGAVAPEVVEPTLRTAVIDPLNRLIRGGTRDELKTRPAAVGLATRVADLILGHAGMSR